MERIHHTNEKSIRKSFSYPQQGLDFKPYGLWYDTDWAWDDWCRSSMPDRRHANHFAIKIDTKKLLVINSAKKMIAFNNKCAERPSWMNDSHPVLEDWNKYINWKAVADKYAGIEIIPYRHDFRRNYMWHYGWDVGGGCVWDLSVIKSIKGISSRLPVYYEESVKLV